MKLCLEEEPQINSNVCLLDIDLLYTYLDVYVLIK